MCASVFCFWFERFWPHVPCFSIRKPLGVCSFWHGHISPKCVGDIVVTRGFRGFQGHGHIAEAYFHRYTHVYMCVYIYIENTSSISKDRRLNPDSLMPPVFVRCVRCAPAHCMCSCDCFLFARAVSCKLCLTSACKDSLLRSQAADVGPLFSYLQYL